MCAVVRVTFSLLMLVVYTHCYNSVGENAVRKMKTLRSMETGLMPLQPEVFEQTLLYIQDAEGPGFWREDNMTRILKAMLLFMEDAVRRGKLMHHEKRSQNLLADLTSSQRDQISNRLKTLAKNPDKILQKVDL